MRINHNIAALNTHSQLSQANKAQQNSMEKLSSGLRINSASDDAAGLAISEKMRGQIRGLEQAETNAQDGISMTQTAEGALNETHSILQRMRELSVQSANDTNTDSDRQELQKEVDQLVEEIDRIADTTEFNTKKLLNGDLSGVSEQAESVEFNETSSDIFSDVSATTTGAIAEDMSYNVKITEATSTDYTLEWTSADGTSSGTETVAAGTGSITIDNATLSLDTAASIDPSNIGEEATFTVRQEDSDTTDNSATFQIGANSSQTMNVGMGDMSASGLNVDGIDISSSQTAEASISAVQNALDDVSAERSKLGAYQNRLDHSINNLSTSSENLTAAESRIRDVDMAKEMMNQTKNSILSQASQSMLAQANQQPQGVLQLLQ
ncbi:flagellin [Gracilibacillus halophilus YIM-C55.5]|uniref:Flagellin n=1 Tax=Gracilibacillus halophilus YIM-C55.5 TaxID=1308866 RepID=N4WQJ3_9BACI|nr:flagellin [Gracilibacillus halophilus]ENH98397.1 flagellin [Gracilibacillus halophilus YIM-C55.5]